MKSVCVGAHTTEEFKHVCIGLHRNVSFVHDIDIQILVIQFVVKFKSQNLLKKFHSKIHSMFLSEEICAGI